MSWKYFQREMNTCLVSMKIKLRAIFEWQRDKIGWIEGILILVIVTGPSKDVYRNRINTNGHLSGMVKISVFMSYDV